jgi:hypothetical protein
MGFPYLVIGVGLDETSYCGLDAGTILLLHDDFGVLDEHKHAEPLFLGRAVRRNADCDEATRR